MATMSAGAVVGLAALSSVINGLFAMETNRKNYANSVSLWDMNNKYNAPVEQMKRLEEAGLNPNLVYGSGSVVGNTSSQPTAPMMQAPKFDLNLQNFLLQKEGEKMQLQNDILETRKSLFGLQYEQAEKMAKLHDKLGLPAGTPWWATMLMQKGSDIGKTFSNIDTFEFGKKLFSTLFGEDGKNNNVINEGNAISLDYIQPEARQNGKVTYTYFDE